MSKNKNQKKKFNDHDFELIHIHLELINQLDEEGQREVLSAAPTEVLDYLKTMKPDETIIRTHRKTSRNKKTDQTTRKKQAEKKKQEEEEDFKSMIKIEIDEECNIVEFFHERIKKPIEEYIIRIEQGKSKLEYGDIKNLAPWQYGIQLCEKLSIIHSKEDLVGNEKCVTVYKDTIKEYFTIAHHTQNRRMALLVSELNEAAHLWAKTETLFKRGILTIQDILKEHRVAKSQYYRLMRCYEFVSKYNKIIYSGIPINTLDRNLDQLEIYLDEHPEYALFLTQPLLEQQPDNLKFDTHTWEFSDPNQEKNQKAKEEADKKRKRDEVIAQQELEEREKKMREMKIRDDDDSDDENEDNIESTSTDLPMPNAKKNNSDKV